MHQSVYEKLFFSSAVASTPSPDGSCCPCSGFLGDGMKTANKVRMSACVHGGLHESSIFQVYMHITEIYIYDKTIRRVVTAKFHMHLNIKHIDKRLLICNHQCLDGSDQGAQVQRWHPGNSKTSFFTRAFLIRRDNVHHILVREQRKPYRV